MKSIVWLVLLSIPLGCAVHDKDANLPQSKGVSDPTSKSAESAAGGEPPYARVEFTHLGESQVQTITPLVLDSFGKTTGREWIFPSEFKGPIKVQIAFSPQSVVSENCADVVGYWIQRTTERFTFEAKISHCELRSLSAEWHFLSFEVAFPSQILVSNFRLHLVNPKIEIFVGMQDAPVRRVALSASKVDYADEPWMRGNRHVDGGNWSFTWVGVLRVVNTRSDAIRGFVHLRKEVDVGSAYEAWGYSEIGSDFRLVSKSKVEEDLDVASLLEQSWPGDPESIVLVPGQSKDLLVYKNDQ